MDEEAKGYFLVAVIRQVPRDQCIKGKTCLLDQVSKECHSVRELAQFGATVLAEPVHSKARARNEDRCAKFHYCVQLPFQSRVVQRQTLEIVVNTYRNQDLVKEERGSSSYFSDEQWLLNVHFLVAVTRILKRFSTQFQVSSRLVCLNDFRYLNSFISVIHIGIFLLNVFVSK